MLMFGKMMRRWEIFWGSGARFSRSPQISRSSRSPVSQKNPPPSLLRSPPMAVIKEWIHIQSFKDSQAAPITRHDRGKHGEPLLANWMIQFGSVDVNLQFGAVGIISIQAKSLEKSPQRIIKQQAFASSSLPASLEEQRSFQFGSVDHYLLEPGKNYQKEKKEEEEEEVEDLVFTTKSHYRKEKKEEENEEERDCFFTTRSTGKNYRREEEQGDKNSLSTSTMGVFFSCAKRGYLGLATKRSKSAMRSFSRSSQADLLAQPLKFKLSSGECKLVLQQGDITKWKIDGELDAIVNAANEQMLGGGGVDGAIHRAAGGELLRACRDLPVLKGHGGARCAVGMAVETPGFQLPVPRIIHTVGPIYDQEVKEECAAYLANAYRNSLKLAREKGVKYIAFPAISCGIYGYPLDDAAKISLNTIEENAAGFLEIHFVLFESGTCQAWRENANRNFELIH